MWLPSNIQNYVTGTLGVLVAVMAFGWWSTTKDLETSRLLVSTNKARYEQAQADYKAKAIEEKARIEKQNVENSKKADASYRELLAQYNLSILRYQTSQREVSRYYTATLNQSTPSSVGPSTDTEFLAIPLEDAKVCAENTARLVAAHEWAKGLK